MALSVSGTGDQVEAPRDGSPSESVAPEDRYVAEIAQSLMHLAHGLAVEYNNPAPAVQSVLRPSTAQPQSTPNRRSTRVTHFPEVFMIQPQSIRIKKKTGRKPTTLRCFMCPCLLAYKCELIKHMQVVHRIERSVSLLYKRVSQGGEIIQRLYGPKLIGTRREALPSN